MKLNRANKIGIVVLLVSVFMVVQALRALFGPEPYPAIKYPGFAAKGDKMIESYELFVFEADSLVPISHYDSELGFTRFKAVLKLISEQLTDESRERIRVMALELDAVEAGDSIRIVRRKWRPAPEGYKEHKTTYRDIRL